jgi:hypothetical protein
VAIVFRRNPMHAMDGRGRSSVSVSESLVASLDLRL